MCVLRITAEAKVLTTYYAMAQTIIVRLIAAVILTGSDQLVKNTVYSKESKNEYKP